MKEASLYNRLPDKKTECHLCAHRCTIRPGGHGVCHVRQNEDGTLVSLVYGRIIARHVDPVEKKPLHHFHPGTLAYSIGAAGCNFRCGWCQNADISQLPRERGVVAGGETTAQEIVAAAQRTGCRMIAYTYTEPTLMYEFARETAALAHDAGLPNVFVTNGYMTREMLEDFHPLLDAANVDLKAFRDETYKISIGARLEPVLESLRTMKQLGVWVEVTTLLIPGINDGDKELRDMARFLCREIGTETPWHLSRFFPAYRMAAAPPTPLATLMKAVRIGREEGLSHIYLGNIGESADTACAGCGETLLRRDRYRLVENRLRPGGRCPGCGRALAGAGLTAKGEGA